MLIAHISDLHVRPDGKLYADLVPSNDMAAAAVRHVNALVPRPDLVIVTGDIVEGGSEEEYAVARRILDQIEVPYFVIPGNHDVREVFRRAFADHRYLPAAGPLHYCVDAHPLRIVALDSTVPGKHHGEIDSSGLAWLEQVLAQESARPTLLLIHHHPFESGIAYLDAYRHLGAEALEAVVRPFASVQRVLCGHVHRVMWARFGQTVAMSCPSTASQIALRLEATAKPASFLEPPGGLLHLWRPGAGLVSHLSPIGDYGPPMPFF
jgi:3',5'-cyclic AMP phosphodiesterase CpdA